MTDPADLYGAIEDEVSSVLVEQEALVERLTIALLTRGHILLEGVPGVAKTTLANVFARATGLEYNRIQMTPDILPADITGTSVYREQTGGFELQRGPIFANIVVADEINRATPKTQSALLESMEEEQTSIDGETLDLPDPFMVIATQNPIEMEGTFELPEAQRDRFQMKIIVDLPSRDAERRVFDRFNDSPSLGPADVEQVIEPAQLRDARKRVSDVEIDDTVREYILDIVRETRSHPDVEHGASPRATLAFLNTTKAYAAINDREYVIPDDVKRLAEPILLHRLVLSTDAELSDVPTPTIIESILENVTPPGGGDLDADLDGGESPPVEQPASDGGAIEPDAESDRGDAEEE